MLCSLCPLLYWNLITEKRRLPEKWHQAGGVRGILMEKKWKSDLNSLRGGGRSFNFFLQGQSVQDQKTRRWEKGKRVPEKRKEMLQKVMKKHRIYSNVSANEEL